MNKITIMGHIGKEINMKHTESGLAICTFSVATTEKWKGKDGQMNEDTTWHNIKAFKRNAETINTYFSKGSKILLEGKQKHNKYEKDGVTKYFAEVELERFYFVDKKSDGKPAEVGTDTAFTTQDIPF